MSFDKKISQLGAQKNKIDTSYVLKLFVTLPEGGGGTKTLSPPMTPQNFLCKQHLSKSYIIKGQGGCIADMQPPGRAAAACAPATHSAEQRRKRERARESGHNEHSLHGEGTPATTLLRQDRLATKRLRKSSRWRGLHLLLRG